MSIQATCPHCASDLPLPSETAGREAQCSRCGEFFTVPAPAQPQWTATAYQAEEPMEVLPADADHFATAFRPGPQGYCETCGSRAPTQYVVFHQHIGAVVMMFHKSIRGNLCATCIRRYFSEFTLTTLFAGWWGMLSFFATPIFLLLNVVRYFSLGPLEDTSPNAMAGPRGVVIEAAGPAGEAARGRLAAARLTAPAVGLLVTGILGVLWFLFGLAINLVPESEPAQRPVAVNARPSGMINSPKPAIKAAESKPKDPWSFPFPVMWYVQGAVSLVVIAGAVQMMRRKMYSLAVTAALLGSVPMLGACCVASVPFGIWGLVVLLNGEVRSAFQ